ncbi:hypothetical protein Pla175_04480 [Pirellulimonas nuda]|uniref:Uncharacterized protein n=1 Tax=Pirellulimonas nuda TaxID=2528009 RepID=A0A518D6H9_9BACT|nr:hypothetical protein [Pirellulimonas nuda]QDU87093.1 hypothetical protein Pla175_04480 [Pirellulimonas nuda]
MTDRERWIIYPLLFLALGAALRDKLAKRTLSDQLVCKTLLVVDEKGRVLSQLEGDSLRIGSKSGEGEIRVGKVLADGVQAGTVQTHLLNAVFYTRPAAPEPVAAPVAPPQPQPQPQPKPKPKPKPAPKLQPAPAEDE